MMMWADTATTTEPSGWIRFNDSDMGGQTNGYMVTYSAPTFDPLRAKRAASKAAHQVLVADARAVRPTSIASRARHGHQQTARLPCYRGVRTR